MLLCARTVLPVTRPPIEDGVVRVSGNRLMFVGSSRKCGASSGEEVFDLGEVILLPGLINAHCHLDYTDMAGQLVPTRLFTDWIKAITAAKGGLSYADFAQSWLKGAQMLVRSGVTTVADVEAVPELLPETWHAVPLRVFSFLEMTGVKSRRDPEAIVSEAAGELESLPASRGGVGLSPHAPYSTVPELLRLTAVVARKRGWRVVTHVAESELEFEMFMNGRGEMFDWLKRNERDMSDCGRGSPVAHLERSGLLNDHLITIHANYLAPGDARILGRHGVSVVHCPRSHAFFRHRPFPLDELVAAGVNLCLGTDSLATVVKARGQMIELSLFAEMQALASVRPDVSPTTILQMATVNGAHALGYSGRLGELTSGALADVIAIPFNGKAADALESVIHHSGNVTASMIDGEWAVRPSV